MVKMPFQCSSMSQPLWVCTSKKMDENTSLHFFLLTNIIKNNRKRRQELDDDVDWYLQNKRKRKNDGSDDILIMTTVQTALMMHSKPQHKPRMPNVDRDGSKIWWSNGYANWSEEEFKHRLRISRENLNRHQTAPRRICQFLQLSNFSHVVSLPFSPVFVFVSFDS